MTYGPFKVKGAGTKQREGNFFSLDPQGTGWSYMAGEFPSNITILNARMMITTAEGEEISNKVGIYNHHAFFIDVSKGIRSNLQCGGESAMKFIPAINSISGSAADSGNPAARPVITTRPTTGNFIGADHKVLLTGDLVNYNNETREVYMVSDMSYVEGKAVGILESTVHLVPVGNCEAKGLLGPLGLLFMRPPKDQKTWSIKGGGLEVKDDGKLLLVRGHMHDGGVNMVLKLNGELVCDSKAEYNAGAVGGHSSGGHGDSAEGMLSNMSACSKGINVKKGDQIYMEANYDLEKHPL
jgi:Stress up-regulated Nod 19